MTEKFGHALHLCRGGTAAFRGDAVITTPFVVSWPGAIVDLDNPALFKHSLNRAVERSRAHLQLAAGARRNFLHDGVAVAVLIGKRNQNVKYGNGERVHSELNYDESRYIRQASSSGGNEEEGTASKTRSLCVRRLRTFSLPAGQPPRGNIRQTDMLKNLLLLVSLIAAQDRGGGQVVPLPPPPTPAQPVDRQLIINGVPGNVGFGPGGLVFPIDLQFQNPQQPGQPLAPGTATVEGSVTVMGTSDPVVGATVEMRKTECTKTGGEAMNTTTGPDGKFSFKQVRAGNWCIGAAKSGGALAPAEYRMRGYKGRGLAVTVADNQQVQDIKLMMPQTGSISGRVIDSDGEPMGHTRVQAMEAFYQDGQKRLYTLNVVQTNDQGEFSLFWLPPGEYYVAAVPEDATRQNVMFSVAPPGIGGHRSDALPPVVTRRNLPDGGFTEDVYRPIYYGGGPDPQRAQKIDVRPGTNNAIELSFAGAQPRSFHIRGRAINGVTGQPAEGAQIRLVPREWTATAIVPYASVDKLGNFDIKGVAPGSYALYAAASTRDPNAPTQQALQGMTPQAIQQLAQQGVNLGGQIPIGARLPIEMGNQNLENVAMNLLPGGTLTGEFILEGNLATDLTGQQRQSLRVNLQREPEIPGATLGGASNGNMNANSPDTSFRIQSIFPGDLRVQVNPFVAPFSWTTPTLPDALQNVFVKAIRLGSADVLADGLHLATSNPDQRLQIVLGIGGKLDGSVMNERNEPMPNVKVALVPDFAYRKRNDLYRSAVTDASGKFKIQGIAPGDYRVLAWEDIAEGAWQDPEVLRGVEARGKVVRISENGQTGVEVVAIPGGRQ